MDLLSLSLTLNVGEGVRQTLQTSLSVVAHVKPAVSTLFPTNPLMRVSMKEAK